MIKVKREYVFKMQAVSKVSLRKYTCVIFCILETYCAKITFSESNAESALKSCGRKVWTALTTQPEWSRGIRFSLPLLAGASSTNPSQNPVGMNAKPKKEKKAVTTMTQKIRDTNKKEIQEFYFWLSQAFGVTEKLPKDKEANQ